MRLTFEMTTYLHIYYIQIYIYLSDKDVTQEHDSDHIVVYIRLINDLTFNIQDVYFNQVNGIVSSFVLIKINEIIPRTEVIVRCTNNLLENS